MKKTLLSCIALFLTLCMTLSACGKSDSDYLSDDVTGDYTDEEGGNESDGYGEGYDNSFYGIFESFNGLEYTAVSDELLNRTINLSSSELSDFKTFISNQKVTYDKIKDADIEKCLSLYESLSFEKAPSSLEIIKNNTVDKNTLLQIIKKNNSKNTDSYYTNISDSNLNTAIGYIVDTINYGLKNNPDINPAVVDYKLRNLRVLIFDDFGYAFYSYEDNIIALNMTLFNLEKGEVMQTIVHETNHLLQDATIKKDDRLAMHYAVCYQFKDVELNYLYWNFLVEGAAQSNTLLQLGIGVDDSFTYYAFVKNLALVSAALSFEGNPYALYNVTSRYDLDELFKLFDCKTQEDKLETIKMMVAFNVGLESGEQILSSPFFERLNIDDTTPLQNKLLASAYKTVSKHFYANLADKIANESVSLGDIYGLISLFEYQLTNVGLLMEENVPYFADFYKSYSAIQGEFFRVISEKAGVSAEDLQKNFNSFYHTTDNDYKISILTPTQTDFYKKMCRNKYLSRGITFAQANSVVK